MTPAHRVGARHPDAAAPRAAEQSVVAGDHDDAADVGTSVRGFLPIVGDLGALAAAFATEPVRWLPAARRTRSHGLTMVVRAGSLRRTVAVEIGPLRHASSTHWRSLSWTPIASSAAIDRLLPRFTGELGLHLPAGGSITLVLDGSYLPPGGKLGATVDAAGMRRVANATVRRVLEDIAGLLSGEALLVTDAAAGQA